MNATTHLESGQQRTSDVVALSPRRTGHETTLSCPHCNESIDISSALHGQIEQEVRTRLEQRFATEVAELDAERSRLTNESAQLKEERARHEERIREAIAAQTESLRDTVRQEVQTDHAAALADLHAELATRTEEIRTLHKTRSENERLKRDHAALEAKLEARYERRHSEQLAVERVRIRESEAERAALAVTEREQVIRQLNEQLKEAQRRAEQGSMQLQGEAQELLIEAWLSDAFPEDAIQSVDKGARGADSLQVVVSQGKRAGSIYYESKRTKAFSERWLTKFRQDMQERCVDFGVLVTRTMPKDMPRMGLCDGVWVCSFDEFKGLALALRESLLMLARSRSAAASTADRTRQLFDYVTGNEFRLLVENLVDGFAAMQRDLETEKRSIQSAWKRRETQLDRALLNTTNLHAAIRGIGGDAVAPVAQLEFSRD